MILSCNFIFTETPIRDMLSSSRDNWERLVAAVVKKDEIWQLFHQDSMTTTPSNSHTNSNSSGEILSNRSERFFVSPPHQPPVASASSLEVDHFGLESFSLHELLVATNNFSDKNVLGCGVLGKVYKGRLGDGSLVAVKRLRQGVTGTELEIASIVAHHNVLRARGFCITEEEQLLVYPCMVNGSVASWLRERHETLPPLDWPMRIQIALGAAKGLAYLHYECPREIIHLNIKATKILLDENFEAVVADLTLGEFVDCCDNDIDTPVRGTVGHIAPEFFTTGKCSVKNDVFGYGVFLLELISGERAVDLARLAHDADTTLLDWVKGIYEEREWTMMVDADLQGDFIDKEVEGLLRIALVCTKIDPEERPTMLEVVRMLGGEYDLAEREEDIPEHGDVGNFSRDKLQAATDDFSNKIISKDSFNMIYKGWLDGFPVAVKRYNSQSLKSYFERELEIGRTCLHPNLVRVIGFCRRPEEQLLVFRLMANGSVESWLRGRHESRPPLTWLKRKKIALGVARGLAFLHNNSKKKIIHRDVKAANILLDDNFVAVVADFKMAQFIHGDNTHITTIVTGTTGHIAPEYLASGKCSDKTDVFGYGAFLLELITGMRMIDLLDVTNDKDMMCAGWVKRNYEERSWKLMVDKDSDGFKFMKAVVKQLAQIAVLCTQYDPDKRPRMSEVVRMLGAE